MIDKDLLAILACPACQGKVSYIEEKIICQQCQRKYPVKNGIPVLLVDEAEK